MFSEYPFFTDTVGFTFHTFLNNWDSDTTDENTKKTCKGNTIKTNRVDQLSISTSPYSVTNQKSKEIYFPLNSNRIWYSKLEL